MKHQIYPFPISFNINTFLSYHHFVVLKIISRGYIKGHFTSIIVFLLFMFADKIWVFQIYWVFCLIVCWLVGCFLFFHNSSIFKWEVIRLQNVNKWMTVVMNCGFRLIIQNIYIIEARFLLSANIFTTFLFVL